MKTMTDTPQTSLPILARLWTFFLLLVLGLSAQVQASDLGLAEADCRCCHGSTLADRHHLTVISRGFECLSCHPMNWNPTALQYDVVVTRDCLQCHTGSLADRHHLLVDQVTIDCFTCHTVIWDPAAMMYVPVFNNSCNVPPQPTALLATINGTVKDTSGSALGWVQVATDSGNYSALTTAAGDFQLADIAPGNYVITASANGYVSASQSITVIDGQTAALDFVLSPVVIPATITGQVMDANLAPALAASISTGNGLYTTLTDADGNFTLSDVTVGSYTLTAEKTGYGSISQNISVTGGQVLVTQLVLPDIPLEICGDGLDNDSNGVSDCADPVCASTLECQPPVEICGDGIDNNANGLIDCDDPLCSATVACVPPAVEICGDGIDNDANALTDCADAACASSADCQVAGAEICGDGIDNDSNGLTDCSDPVCMGTAGCPSPTAEVCGDGIDNNGDGLLDCADPICSTATRCLYEMCNDSIDNDGNGLTDCADPICANTSKCLPPPVDICSDGLDNDDNGQADCDDAKCASRSACATPVVEELCSNGIDDNADGSVDCADTQCMSRSVCMTEICGNSLDDDDDGDGVADCADSDCVNDAACAAPTTPQPISFSARTSGSEDGSSVDKLADGDMNTRWWTDHDDDEWVWLDLGGSYWVNEINIHWSTEYAEEYKIKVSKDGRYWKTVKEIDHGVGGIDTLSFDAREARHVIVDLEDAATSGYSINEIEVFEGQFPTSATDPHEDGSGSDDGATSASSGDNMALNTPVLTSGFVVGYEPQMAVDANKGTRWKSQGSDDEWMRVDLGNVVSVNKVIIHWHRDYAEDYKVKVSSDGNKWKTVMEIKHGNGGRDKISFASRDARYIQIDCEDASHDDDSGTQTFSIYELEVYRRRARN
ncbi:MAG: discoidin domain-containing protein [Candidatus Thiodiazotropha sp. (ex Dulcina madagascariensis)]|nr:discoidin domain-containing protein [Candidatus Thiodiazotropha sp. (ex Dulcina madagascariensis)]